jgi:E3 ubiquitin-protein ligase mind-bomb
MTGLKDKTMHNGIALAIERDDPVAIFEFFKNGQSVDATDEQGLTLLHHAVLLDKPKAALALLKLGAHPHEVGAPDGYTALHFAVCMDNPKMIDLLVEQGQANVAVRSDGLLTPLQLAAHMGKKEAAACLLHHHADPDQTDGEGNSVFDIIRIKLLECSDDSADIEPYAAILEILNNASGKSTKIISLPDAQVRPATQDQEIFLKTRARIKGAPRFDF